MTRTIVIVEKIEDRSSSFHVDQFVTPQEYLLNWDDKLCTEDEPINVINLCHNFQYQDYGYYCSLLAEARGHFITPSVKAFNDLSRPWPTEKYSPRKKKRNKKSKYHLAILHDPNEPIPPSDKKALKKFIQAGKEQDVHIEFLNKTDLDRIHDFDALFIRETTSLNHHTYRFARRAEDRGLIVIDDPMSILRCSNKIFMNDLLNSHHIPAPKGMLIARDDTTRLASVVREIGFPMILKIPDGAFSRGVYKVESMQELVKVSQDLFRKTALLLAQEYFYTDFDWRIGVLNDRPIFACKYYMTKGHWQIYNHVEANQVQSGPSETLPLWKVPEHVLKTAVEVSHHVGDSLYGVDLKEKDGRSYVIEINDNPNIDTDIEDAVEGMDLYHHIIHDFVRRIEEKR